MRNASKNLLAITGGDLSRRVLGFATVAYLARVMTTADFGAINIGYSVLSYGLVVSAGGLGTLGVREVARGAADELVGTLTTLRLLGALIGYAATAFVALSFVRDPVVTKLLLIFSLSYFSNAFLLEWYFQGKEKMGVVGAVRVASALIYLGGVLFLVHSSADIAGVAIAAVLADAMASIVLMVMYYRNAHELPFRCSLKGSRTILRQSLHLGAGSIFAQLSVNLPAVVIGIMLSNADAGIFSAAYKLVIVLLVFDRGLATLLLPAASRLHAESPEILVRRLNIALKFILMAALPLAVGGSLLAVRLVPLVYGAQYLEASNVFAILVWFLFFTMIHTIYTSGIVAVGLEREYGRVMFVSMIVFVIAVTLGAAYAGVIGVAAAVVFAEFLTLLMMRSKFHSTVKTALPRELVWIVFAAALMASVVMLLSSFHILLLIPIGALVYATVLFATRAITLSELTSIIRRV